MPLFKKKNIKENKKEKFFHYLEEQVALAKSNNKNCVYTYALDESEDFVMEFAETRGMRARASHSNDGVVYYKIFW